MPSWAMPQATGVEDIGRIEPPANPTSTMQASAGVRAKARKAAAVVASKKLSSIPSAASSASPSSCGELVVSISCPARRMRSLKRTRCGLE
jgi:hypothetical protein